jgi:hypothetical protein
MRPRNDRERSGNGKEDMARIDLDPGTAERLIAGRVAAGDLPPGLDRVAAVLEAARLSATQGDMARLDTTVVAMVDAAVRAAGAAPAAGPPPVAAPAPGTGRPPTSSRLSRLLAGSVAGLTALFGGLAAAGALPASAQNPVADLVSHVGIDLPGGEGAGRGGGSVIEPTSRPTTPTTVAADDGTTESTAVTTETTVAGPSCPTPAPDNHGDFVADAAHSTTTSVDAANHGADVSAAARSDCGKPPQAGDDHGTSDTTATTAGSANPDDHGPPTTTERPDNGSGGPPGSSGNGNGQSNGDNGSPSDAHRPASP